MPKTSASKAYFDIEEDATRKSSKGMTGTCKMCKGENQIPEGSDIESPYSYMIDSFWEYSSWSCSVNSHHILFAFKQELEESHEELEQQIIDFLEESNSSLSTIQTESFKKVAVTGRSKVCLLIQRISLDS